jgi:hypothetical protein
MKKDWTKPKLISLYRGHPEEAVLSTCKSEDAAVAGPLGVDCDGSGGADCLDCCAT